MNTSVGERIRRPITLPAGFRLAVIGAALLVTAMTFSAQRSQDVDLETLDPLLMKAVTASVSQRDVQAVLFHRRSSGPVHLHLYTSCDETLRCTVFTTMDFPHSTFRPMALSLQVTTQVTHDGSGAHRAATSAWHVESLGPAMDKKVGFAGDFSDFSKLARDGEGEALARLLASIQSAVETVLVAHGVSINPNRSSGVPSTPADRLNPDMVR